MARLLRYIVCCCRGARSASVVYAITRLRSTRYYYAMLRQEASYAILCARRYTRVRLFTPLRRRLVHYAAWCFHMMLPRRSRYHCRLLSDDRVIMLHYFSLLILFSLFSLIITTPLIHYYAYCLTKSHWFITVWYWYALFHYYYLRHYFRHYCRPMITPSLSLRLTLILKAIVTAAMLMSHYYVATDATPPPFTCRLRVTCSPPLAEITMVQCYWCRFSSAAYLRHIAAMSAVCHYMLRFTMLPIHFIIFIDIVYYAYMILQRVIITALRWCASADTAFIITHLSMPMFTLLRDIIRYAILIIEFCPSRYFDARLLPLLLMIRYFSLFWYYHQAMILLRYAGALLFYVYEMLRYDYFRWVHWCLMIWYDRDACLQAFIDVTPPLFYYRWLLRLLSFSIFESASWWYWELI